MTTFFFTNDDDDSNTDGSNLVTKTTLRHSTDNNFITNGNNDKVHDANQVHYTRQIAKFTKDNRQYSLNKNQSADYGTHMKHSQCATTTTYCTTTTTNTSSWETYESASKPRRRRWRHSGVGRRDQFLAAEKTRCRPRSSDWSSRLQGCEAERAASPPPARSTQLCCHSDGLQYPTRTQYNTKMLHQHPLGKHGRRLCTKI